MKNNVTAEHKFKINWTGFVFFFSTRLHLLTKLENLYKDPPFRGPLNQDVNNVNSEATDDGL